MEGDEDGNQFSNVQLDFASHSDNENQVEVSLQIVVLCVHFKNVSNLLRAVES